MTMPDLSQREMAVIRMALGDCYERTLDRETARLAKRLYRLLGGERLELYKRPPKPWQN